MRTYKVAHWDSKDYVGVARRRAERKQASNDIRRTQAILDVHKQMGLEHKEKARERRRKARKLHPLQVRFNILDAESQALLKTEVISWRTVKATTMSLIDQWTQLADALEGLPNGINKVHQLSRSG
jgi:hypothetical protein